MYFLIHWTKQQRFMFHEKYLTTSEMTSDDGQTIKIFSPKKRSYNSYFIMAEEDNIVANLEINLLFRSYYKSPQRLRKSHNKTKNSYFGQIVSSNRNVTTSQLNNVITAIFAIILCLTKVQIQIKISLIKIKLTKTNI